MNNYNLQSDNTTDLNVNIKNYNEYILNSLNLFYGSINNKEPSNEINRILPILSGKSILSIRVIDWFVTNYSKKHNIIYLLEEKDGKIIKYFNVYMNYKSQLKGYKKKIFDPFCRNRRIPFYYTYDKCLITTIGQLNFFKWAIIYKVLDYIENNLYAINSDMNYTIKTKSCSSKNSSISENTLSSDKKRNILSTNTANTINCIKMNILLDLN
jgi:hypothetical protein